MIILVIRHDFSKHKSDLPKEVKWLCENFNHFVDFRWFKFSNVNRAEIHFINPKAAVLFKLTFSDWESI